MALQLLEIAKLIKNQDLKMQRTKISERANTNVSMLDNDTIGMALSKLVFFFCLCEWRECGDVHPNIGDLK